MAPYSKFLLLVYFTVKNGIFCTIVRIQDSIQRHIVCGTRYGARGPQFGKSYTESELKQLQPLTSTLNKNKTFQSYDNELNVERGGRLL